MIKTKNIHGESYTKEIINGMKEIFDAVSSTYGPNGLNVIIESDGDKVRVTKDGATVAQYMFPKGIGGKLVQEVTSQVADSAGDGTTTCTILIYYLVVGAYKLISMGENPIKVKKEIEFITNEVVKYLESKSIPINLTNETEILKVATISANGDEKIGNYIKEAIIKVKTDGAITVEEGSSMDTQVDLTEGFHFSSGHMSSYFINNIKKSITQLEDTFILVYEKKLSSIKSIIQILEKVAQSGKSLLIIADDVDNSVLTTLIMNQQRGLKVCAVKAPGYGDRKKDNLLDIAIATGAKLVTEDTGLNTYDVKIDVLGHAKKVIVSKTKTLLINVGGKNADIESRKEEIRTLKEKTSSEYEKDKLSERLAKLGNGVAVIKVGGSGEVERKELKDRVDDSLHATKAALEQGILPGGGSSLFYASEFILNKMIENSSSSDLRVSVAKMIKMVLRKPLKHILKNAGIEDEHTVFANLEKEKFGYGYNVINNIFGNMINDLGIIDPSKVVITALKHAASLANIAITTKVGVLREEEKPLNKHQYS